MRDENKTPVGSPRGKAQLISKLVELRRRIAELEQVTRSPRDCGASGETAETGRMRAESNAALPHRDAALEALRQERGFAESLIETAQVIVLVLDTQGRIVHFNPYLEEISGYRLEEAQGKDWFTTFLPERDRTRIQELFQRAVSGIPTRGNVNPIVTKDGREREIEWYDTTLKHADGDVVGVLSIGQDITERVRAEEELRNYRDHLEEMVRERTAELAQANEQLQGEIAERMQVQEAMQQRNRELELLNRAGQAFVSTLDLEQVLATVLEEVRQVLGVVGSSVWLTDPETDIQKGTGAAGLVCRQVVGPGSDIVRGWRLAPGQGLAGWVVQSGESLNVPDAHTDERYFEGVDRQTGLAIHSILTVPLRVKQKVIGVIQAVDEEISRFTPTDLTLMESLASAAAVAIENARLYQQAQREIGERVRMEVALRESNCRLEETLAELKATQQQIVQQERLAAVGQLAAGIAHDFNNLLTSIVGYAELLQMSPDLPATAEPRVARIVQQGQRAAHLVQQILDFSRKSIRQPQPLNLVPFLKEITQFLERTIPESIHILLEFEAVERLVQADPTQLHQILTNLAVNARDAMPKGGELKLRLSGLTLEPGEPPPCPEMPPGEWVVLSVSDTGIGIPKEILPHIFEPFFTTKAPEGSGLGLAQVYGIVKQHEGCIDVESEIGKGATFNIYLPALAVAEKAAGEEPPKDIPRGRGETVLLVEDEPAVLDTGKAMLVHLGYRVLTAVNGQQALEVYGEHQDEVALVLADMVMPEMDGMTLFQVLKVQNPAIKMVLITGYPPDEETQAVLAQGVVEWLQKPMPLTRLAQVVSRALRR